MKRFPRYVSSVCAAMFWMDPRPVKVMLLMVEILQLNSSYQLACYPPFPERKTRGCNRSVHIHVIGGLVRNVQLNADNMNAVKGSISRVRNRQK